MNHSGIDTGMLRAYLDGELNAEMKTAVGEHAAACDACRTELKALNSRAASVRAGLDYLPEAVNADGTAAWSVVRAVMNEGRGARRILWTPARIWSTAAAGLVVAAAVAVVTVAPLREWAENLLSIFRVEHVAVVDLSSGTLRGQQADLVFNQTLARIIADEVTFTEPPRKPQVVADAAAALKAVGFNAHLLGGETPSTLMVRSTITAQMKFDRERLQAMIDEAGRTDLRIPPSVDGAVIGLRAPAGVMAFYGNCGDVAAQPGGENQGGGAAEDSTCVKLNELPSPTASAPADLDPAQLVQVALQFAGLSATDAANFTQTVDWTTTFVLPIMHGEASYEKVNVNGNEGVLLRRKLPHPSAQFNLVWVDDGILYSLMGTGDDTRAVNLAGQIE